VQYNTIKSYVTRTRSRNRIYVCGMAVFHFESNIGHYSNFQIQSNSFSQFSSQH